MRSTTRTTTTAGTVVALALTAGLVVAATPALGLPAAAAADVRASAAAATDRLLRQGDRGADVRQWQQALNRVLPSGGRIAEDGAFGPATRRATVAVQARLGVPRDGVVGPVTRDGLAGLADGAPVAEQPAGDRLLRTGLRGADVRDWQRGLNRAIAARLVEHRRLAEDGVFGAGTHSATIRLQDALGVSRDGVVGPVTRDGLAGLLER